MRVAVLTLTRDRLEYTKHCFDRLWEFAGCDFDHYVLDQGSTDGTDEWLADEYDAHALVCETENIGIAAGMNLLLHIADREAQPPYERYDVIVKFDNDCELTQPNTLRDVCALALEGDALLSPRILGLNNPPPVTRELRIGDEVIQDVPQIGGIFLAAPAWVYDEFRYSDDLPVWGGDDVEICAWFRREHGGTCGYVARLEAWHYESTSGQHERFPAYFERTLAEGKAAL